MDKIGKLGEWKREKLPRRKLWKEKVVKRNEYGKKVRRYEIRKREKMYERKKIKNEHWKKIWDGVRWRKGGKYGEGRKKTKEIRWEGRSEWHGSFKCLGGGGAYVRDYGREGGVGPRLGWSGWFRKGLMKWRWVRKGLKRGGGRVNGVVRDGDR